MTGHEDQRNNKELFTGHMWTHNDSYFHNSHNMEYNMYMIIYTFTVLPFPDRLLSSRFRGHGVFPGHPGLAMWGSCALIFVS